MAKFNKTSAAPTARGPIQTTGTALTFEGGRDKVFAVFGPLASGQDAGWPF